MNAIQHQITAQNQTNFKISIYHHIGEKKKIKLKWENLDEFNMEIGIEERRKSLGSQVSTEVDNFYHQAESKLFECEIVVEIDHIFLEKE